MADYEQLHKSHADRKFVTNIVAVSIRLIFHKIVVVHVPTDTVECPEITCKYEPDVL